MTCFNSSTAGQQTAPKAIPLNIYVHNFFSCFCPCNWGARKRVDTAPKASGCFLGGAQEIFDADSEDLLGGTGKAEAVKLQGAGIIPKQCPMERAETAAMRQNGPGRCQQGPELRVEVRQTVTTSSSLANRVPRRTDRRRQALDVSRTTGWPVSLRPRIACCPCYILCMPKIIEQWLLFRYVGGEFTPLSKPFKTREHAEKGRLGKRRQAQCPA
jgi:hypothetical protein